MTRSGAANRALGELLDAAWGPTPVPPEVAALVATRAPTGRGMAVPSAGDGGSVPAREILRVAVGVLADLAGDLPDPASDPGPGAAPAGAAHARAADAQSSYVQSSYVRPSYVLAGAPRSVVRLRAALAEAGRPEHRPRTPWWRLRPDRPDLVVVMAPPLADLLREEWTRRVLAGSAQPWRRHVTACRTTGLPPAVRVDRAAARWRELVGADRVHVVAGDGPDREAALASLLGAHLDGEVWRRGADDLDPVFVDVLRRVNAVLPFTDAPERRRARLAALLPEARSGRRLRLPRPHRDWLATAGGDLGRSLEATGARLHGDLGRMGARDRAAGRRLDPDEVLAAAVALVRRGAGAGAAEGVGDTGPMREDR